jgi:hypothetical protein
MEEATVKTRERTGLVAATLCCIASCCIVSCDQASSTSGQAAAPTATTTVAASAAPSASAPAPDGRAAWLLKGTTDERFARVAKQLRGFDMAMVETGYRYTELYWAGRDENWKYAAYQAEKIRTAVGNGTERRPKRAKSAKMLYPVMDLVDEAIKAEDPAEFAKSFEALTDVCNACHRAEDMAFVTIAPPTHRHSPVRPLPANEGGAPASP